jgi:hypothetical protein
VTEIHRAATGDQALGGGTAVAPPAGMSIRRARREWKEIMIGTSFGLAAVLIGLLAVL